MTTRHEIHAEDTDAVVLRSRNFWTSVEETGIRRILNAEVHHVSDVWIDRGPAGVTLTLFMPDGDCATFSLFGTDLMDKIKAEVCVSEMHDQEPI